MSDDPAQDYFADGMTEDLITDLSKISGPFLIAPSLVTYVWQAVVGGHGAAVPRRVWPFRIPGIVY